MKRLFVISTLLILTACAAPITATPSPSPTATSTTPPPTSTPTAIPTPTTTPSPTVYASPTFPVFPTATITPTPTEYGALPPNFLELDIADDFLFAAADDPTCQLPCWQGLRVGDSNRQDIQGVLDTVFQFNGAVDHFKYNTLDKTTIAFVTSDVPGMEVVGYEWKDPSVEENYAYFHTYMVVDSRSGILQGIRLLYSSKGTYHSPTPQEVIEQLGIPSYLSLFVLKMGVEGPSDVGLNTILRLIYKEGIAIEFYYWVIAQSRNTAEGEELYAEYCMDGIKFDTGGDVYIVAPFTDLFEGKLPPIQEEWIYDLVDTSNTNPRWYYEIADSDSIIKSKGELFGVNAEEFAEVALQAEHPCLEINVSALGE